MQNNLQTKNNNLTNNLAMLTKIKVKKSYLFEVWECAVDNGGEERMQKWGPALIGSSSIIVVHYKAGNYLVVYYKAFKYYKE